MHASFVLPVVAINRNGQRVLINEKDLDLSVHSVWVDEQEKKEPELPVEKEPVAERDTLTRGKTAKK
jgi:hypothetical protein